MDFNEQLIDTFKKIGFLYIGTEKKNIDKDNSNDYNICDRYEYYSPHLSESHYTLIVYKYTRGLNNIKDAIVDFRLYIHANSNGRYIYSPFQCSTHSEHNRVHIKNVMNNHFHFELRSLTIDEILN